LNPTIRTVTGADHSDRQTSGIEWEQHESVKGLFLTNQVALLGQRVIEMIAIAQFTVGKHDKTTVGPLPQTTRGWLLAALKDLSV
jgi:hypothetical protein